jgi:outer membrane protein assembly factor BamB
MTRTRLRAALACLLGLTLASLPLSALSIAQSPWGQWRGPTGQGHSDDESVPLTWGEKQNLVWKTPLPGVGNSTPVVWEDRIFLTAASPDGQKRLVVCISAGDGKVLWQQVASEGVPAGRTHEWNGHASPSCATEGKHVYAFFGTPGLFCYDLDGKLVWKHTFGVFTSAAGWGTAASPFLYQDLVIQNCDNDGPKALPPGAREEAAPQALVALEKATGRVVWTTPRDQGRGFSTPVLLRRADGREDLVLNGPRGVWGYDPHTGKERWRCTRSDPKDAHLFGEPIPVFDQQTMFIQSGRPGPCQAVRLPDSGDVTKTNLIWEGVRKGHRDVASPILWEGLVYAADNKGMLTCLELKTGKELYNERLGGGKVLASPVAVRGRLLFVMDDGVTVVLKPGPTFQVEARNKLGSGQKLDFGASPAIAHGRLYLRAQSELYCIGQTR